MKSRRLCKSCGHDQTAQEVVLILSQRGQGISQGRRKGGFRGMEEG